MPIAALMRHGDACAPPVEELTFDSCEKNIALFAEVGQTIGRKAIIATSLEHETMATARVAHAMFDADVFVFPGLSEKGTPKEMDVFVDWLIKQILPVSIFTHRKRVKSFFAALMRITGKTATKMPGFRYKLFERYPRAILIDTDTMETKIVQARRKEKAPP